MKYGVPYKGSKNKIAAQLIASIPSAETFVDLFAGGCAMTHAAMVSGRFQRFIANDLDGQGLRLFCDAVNGQYADERRWIPRERFQAEKLTDAYISICWSFGNNQRDYLYGKHIEPIKRAYHFAYFFGDYEQAHALGISYLDGIFDVPMSSRYAEFTKRIRNCENIQHLQRLKSLERLQSLESLERLQRLQSLERLERLQSLQLDFQSVEIPPDSIVYCDPPYSGTNGYSKDSSKTTFDNGGFWDWARSNRDVVLVSEYNAPDDFIPVISLGKQQSIAANRNNVITENLYIHAKSALRDLYIV